MSDLKTKIESLASSFADGVLAAVRSASLDDLLAESGASPRGPSAARTRGRRAAGRLTRRSAQEIARTLDRVVSAVKASKGLRAEEIRKALSLDVREVPRVLKEGLKTRKLRAKGQKRATTYFAR